MKANDNAFPMVVSESSSEAHTGLTKREYFAALICSGLAACPEVRMDKGTAELAVESADLLIAALNA